MMVWEEIFTDESAGEFFLPKDVVVDSADNVQVLDQMEVNYVYYNIIQKFDMNGNYLATVLSFDRHVSGVEKFAVDGSGNLILLNSGEGLF